MHNVRPTLKANAFNCPHCGAFSHQVWHRLLSVDTDAEERARRAFSNIPIVQTTGAPSAPPATAPQLAVSEKYEAPQLLPASGLRNPDNVVYGSMLSACVSCRKVAIWVEDRMVFPVAELAALPHAEMPIEAAKTFREAATIVALSPRAATALLRLSIEQICRATDVKPARINDMIGELVSKGLPEKIQMSLDIVRVTGNEAVHPGQIDTDRAETATQLFELVNLIVEEVIARPRRIEGLYGQLPAEKRNEIERRNGKAQD